MLTVLALAALVATGFPPARAHHAGEHGNASPRAPAAEVPLEAHAGAVEVVVIEDRVVDTTIRYAGLRLEDGRSFALKGAAVETLTDGARVEATGRRNGNTLFVTQARVVAAPQGASRIDAKALQTRQVVGMLRLAHADYFDVGRSENMFDVETDDGDTVPLKLAVLPDALHAGIRVILTGTTDIDGRSLRPDNIVILALAPLRTNAISPNSTTTDNVLVILMRYANQPTIPFTQAAVQTTYGGGTGTGSVAEYYKEVSSGHQLLNVTVTPWMQKTDVNTPATCDWSGSITSIGNSLATAAGYVLGNYQRLVYVFPALSACGWAGLAYVPGTRSYINGYNRTSVYGHELGHNFGLLHAAYLRCTNTGVNDVIGGSCSVSEYGDLFDIMGNQTAMHINAQQKNYLGWLPSGSVVTQSAGAATHALAPIELGGGTTYAVTVPTRSNRTYWMEYRQPVGYFDQGMSSYPNNGIQVRVENPFEWGCNSCDDTELLDMVPATSTFGDAALVAGKNFRDPKTGVSLSVLAATPTNLSLFVQMNT